MFGTFVKFPTTQAIEILAEVGFDFVIIDQEHAPIDRGTADLMILAARACGLAPLVRISEYSDANILTALDCGACGILVPHVNTAEKARRIAAACRYRNGSRGFVGMSRAAGWGRFKRSEHIANQDAQIACIAMIEDPEAVSLTQDIASVRGIDAVFVGQGDLTASLEGQPGAEKQVISYVQQVAEGLAAAGVPMMMIPKGPGSVAEAYYMNANALVLSSDHGFLMSAAQASLKAHKRE
jgi:2-keto-3-deoxy-L-rhamnonate aldolase RhmA